MKLKFVSDGTPTGTRVLCAETGEVLEGVVEFTIYADPEKAPYCVLWFQGMEIDMLADLPEEENRPHD